MILRIDTTLNTTKVETDVNTGRAYIKSTKTNKRMKYAAFTVLGRFLKLLYKFFNMIYTYCNERPMIGLSCYLLSDIDHAFKIHWHDNGLYFPIRNTFCDLHLGLGLHISN